MICESKEICRHNDIRCICKCNERVNAIFFSHFRNNYAVIFIISRRNMPTQCCCWRPCFHKMLIHWAPLIFVKPKQTKNRMKNTYSDAIITFRRYWLHKHALKRNLGQWKCIAFHWIYQMFEIKLKCRFFPAFVSFAFVSSMICDEDKTNDCCQSTR